ncbi:MAG: transporter substrate-binding protein [Rhizobiaceae bacterium]|nr:transporter substrate-binding protein [Rhizobiaceae bacterium]
MKRRVELGLLYSRSGNYALLGEACRAGALMAIEAVNADPQGPIEFVPIERDPEGRIDAYGLLCEDILRRTNARHILGCITSWSRKEVIPVLEKFGGQLWYACPYEGFEANEHVVYMHACPNQHLLPLIAYVAPRFGPDAFFVGSNYIWGWETNRVARDLVLDAGGQVKGERYLAMGDTDVDRLIEEIRATVPDFVLNTLIGPSSYAFFEAYAALGREDERFRPEKRPIVSCNLTEHELPALGTAGEGHLSIGPFFDAARPGSAPAPTSSFMAAAHAAVTVLAVAIARTGSDSPAATAAAFSGGLFDTVLGEIAIDRQTQHASLPVRLGRIRGKGFEILEASSHLVPPDPYLSRYDPKAVFPRLPLRVVR